MPFVYWIGRLCEEFHCGPPAAWAMWEQSPVGLLEEVVEARHYARMKAIFDAERIEDSELYTMVKLITFDLAKASRPPAPTPAPIPVVPPAVSTRRRRRRRG